MIPVLAPLNVFTTPEDLGTVTINEGMTRVGAIRNWHGFDGLDLGCYAYESKLFNAWKDSSGLNKWVMMPMAVLNGEAYPGDSKIFEGNLFDNRNEGDLKATLVTSGADVAWHGSCTELRTDPIVVWGVRFSDGSVGWHPRVYYPFSVRPCLAQELTL